jgi:monoamine oxidase
MLTDIGHSAFDAIVRGLLGANPRDVSLLFLLFYIRAAGNEQTPGTIERLVATTGGAQESRFVGGSQLVSLQMARELGGRVILKSPVRRIVQKRGRVLVEADRVAARGRRVIVAIPPTLAGRVSYAPGLPGLRDQLTQRMPQGSTVKCEAVYDRPFWRERGLAGSAGGDAHPVIVTFDHSPPDGSPGVLAGFVEATDARGWDRRPAAERRQAVLDSLAAYFGPEARNPVDYFEMDWRAEAWTRGDPVGFMPPGVMLDYGRALREPVGLIHWAGTETSTFWNGYMDGAVRSGERAAREVLAQL